MKARVKLFGTENTIIRPVLIKIIKDILNNIGCKPDVYIDLDENTAIYKGHNRTRMNGKNKVQDNLNRISGNKNEFIKITSYEDSLADGNENDLGLRRPDTIPLFIDKEINLYVRPIVQRRKVVIGLEYSNINRTSIIALCNSLSLINVYPGGVYYHDVEYTYSIPRVICALLYSIYGCKNKSVPENEKITFWNYLGKVSDDRLTYQVPDSGMVKDLALAIRERQASIVGYFSDTISDLKPEPNDNNGFSINLQYTYNYDEVTGFECNYPFLVYNNPIYKDFIITNKTTQRSNVNLYNPLAGCLFKGNEENTISSSPYVKTDYVMIPTYDDVMDNCFPSYYGRMLVNLIRISLEDKRSLLNIKSFSKEVSFKSGIMDLILGQEREFVTKDKRSFVFIGLYEDGVLKLNHPLTLNEDGELVSDVDLDIKKTYRVGFFLLTNYNYISDTDMDRLMKSLGENFRIVSSTLKAELMKYELLNKDLLVTNAKEYYLGIASIKNNYITSVDTLADLLNLTEKEKDEIVNSYPNHISMFFKIVKREVRYTPTTQLFSIRLDTALDYKPRNENKGE